jgi:hypothetical protein
MTKTPCLFALSMLLLISCQVPANPVYFRIKNSTNNTTIDALIYNNSYNNVLAGSMTNYYSRDLPRNIVGLYITIYTSETRTIIGYRIMQVEGFHYYTITIDDGDPGMYLVTTNDDGEL